MVTVGYSRLQQVTELLQWVTAGYRRLPSTLQQVTEWFQWVTAGYSRLPSGYSGFQPVTEWLQWVTEVNSRLPSGYNTKPQMMAGTHRDLQFWC